MSSIPVSASSYYQTLLALRQAGFSDQRVYKAMAALFSEPDSDQDDEPDDDNPIDWPPSPDHELSDPWEPPAEPYEPTPEDLAEYAAWSESLDRDREFVEAMARADIYEAIEDGRRFTDQDLRAAGLPAG